MSLVVYLVVTFGAAGVAVIGRGREGVASGVGFAGLAVAVLAAIAIDPTQTLTIGGAVLATSEYVRLFLILGSLVGLALAIVGLAAGSSRDAPAVMLGTLGGGGLALSLPDPRIAVLAATAGGLGSVLLALTPTRGRIGATTGIRALRALVIAGAMAIAATAWIGRDLSQLAAQPVVFGLAYLAFGLAVAIRFGAIPFHVWAARLTDAVPEAALPVVTAWGPAAFAVVALAWTDASVAPLLVEMDAERAIILAIGVASIVLAAFAAWIQDDLEHVVGYSIIGDTGVVMLAIAALSTDAWAPARMWILAYVVTRSAFAAWAASLRATFGTGRIPDLRGWAIRAPVLGVTFGLIVIAAIGLPGLAAFEARKSLVELALGGPLQFLVFLGTFAPLAYYGRLLVIGLARTDVARTEDRMPGVPQRTPLDLNDVRGSARTFWAANRSASSVLVASLVAVLAFTVAAGGLGGPAAAGGLPPSLEGPTESFVPAPEPSLEASFPIESEPPGESVGPSFQPIPTE
jgi:formate hydrogenlyase subunit 3/multisubunit Na+/H+ antiporter MnhD subunit